MRMIENRRFLTIPDAMGRRVPVKTPAAFQIADKINGFEQVFYGTTLKSEIKSGKFLTPPKKAEKEENEGTKEVAQEVAHTLKEAIEKYKEERDTLGKKDPATCKREKTV